MLLPALFVLAGWIWWAAADGGFFIADWAPVSILFFALAFAIALGTGRVLPDARLARIALLCLAGWVAWTFLSMLWAESQGEAWETGAKLLPILAGCWILSLIPWTPSGATAFAGTWAVGVAVVCFVALLEARGAADLGGLRTVGRLTVPTGYTNSAAALAWLAFSPALLISLRKSVPPALQGVGLGAAVLLLEYGLLPQSRGALLAIVASTVVLVVAAPDRLRLLLRVAVAGGLLALASGPILDVQQAADARSGVEAAISDAARALAITSLAGAVVGMLIGYAERAAAGREQVARTARKTGLVLVAIVCAGLLVVAAVNAGAAVDKVSDNWSQITDEHSSAEGRSSRFSSLDPEGRTDAWRVALDLFEEHPVVGIGAGNYGREYTARREVERHSRYVHDIWLRALAEGGLIGGLLLVAALAAAVAACLAARRRHDDAGRVVIAACLATATMFFAHASLDWLEEFPGLALPGFGLLFVGACLVVPGQAPAPPVRRRVPVLAAAEILALLAVIATLMPYLADSWTTRAFATFRAKPAQAYDDLSRARGANPLDPDGWSSEGTIALALGDVPRATGAFRRSIGIEDNWYARLELSLIEASRGRFAAAARNVEVADRLNPVDPSVAEARRLIRERRRIDPARFNARLVQTAQSYFERPAR